MTFDRPLPVGNTPHMPTIDTDDYVTVGHAAQIAGVSRYWMRQQVQAGKVAGVCIDGLWFVLRTAAEEFVRHPTAGRPRAE